SAIRTSPTVESLPAVRRTTRQMRVDDYQRRFGLRAANLDTSLLMKGCQHHRPSAVLGPPTELGPHPGPFAKLGREVTPLAPGLRRCTTWRPPQCADQSRVSDHARRVEPGEVPTDFTGRRTGRTGNSPERYRLSVSGT